MLTDAFQPRKGAGFLEEEACQSVSASIKQSWGEGAHLLGNHRRLRRSELLPWLLTAMKTGLCIEPESLGSQSVTGLGTWQLPHQEGKNQIPALFLISPTTLGEGQRGYSPTVLASTARHTHRLLFLRLSMAAAKLCSWSQRNVEQSLEFFFCRETSTFEFQIPFRPPEQAHCLQESAKPQSSSASLESTGGLFPVYILFLLAGL